MKYVGAVADKSWHEAMEEHGNMHPELWIRSEMAEFKVGGECNIVSECLLAWSKVDIEDYSDLTSFIDAAITDEKIIRGMV